MEDAFRISFVQDQDLEPTDKGKQVRKWHYGIGPQYLGITLSDQNVTTIGKNFKLIIIVLQAHRKHR